MTWMSAHAEWQELEQLATYARRPDGTCWKCGGQAGLAALCDTCNNRRLGFYERFGGRAGSHRSSSRRIGFRSERPERLPYRDAEDSL